MPRVPINGMNIYYEVHGRPDKPTFLLLHGFAGSTVCWKTQVEELSQSFRVIVYDMRGHGLSESPHDPSLYSMAIAVEDQHKLLRYLGAGPGVIEGLSLGGSVALHFYFRHPGMVRALVLAGTGPGYRNTERMEAWNRWCNNCAEVLEKQGMDGFMRSPYSESCYYTPAEVMWAHDPIGLANVTRGISMNPHMLPLEEIKVPTLILCGENDNEFLAAADYMHKKIKGSQKVIIPGAGHAINVDQPEAFNRAILNFWKGKNW